MIKFIKKLFTKWFSGEKVLELMVEEPVVEKPTHCTTHLYFKKSCSGCRAIIK
tara:strand:- start:925 stop:1083 length:159 start_codon:yes stop_codon:yes gene_type:complete